MRQDSPISLLLSVSTPAGAKHSDKKSTVSAIGYCPNASPLQPYLKWLYVTFGRRFPRWRKVGYNYKW